MIIIADSGATKTHWVIMDDGSVQLELYSKGFNPYYYKTEEFTKSLFEQFRGKVIFEKISAIHFYAAGCSSDANAEIIRNALSRIFTNAQISANHDLYGAAIALLGNNRGIACILGTGSNSCLWDGQSIIHNVPSLGYMLGDEGSGTYLGKLLVREILLGIADKEITKQFYKTVQMDFSGVLDEIYKKPNPNQFLSQQSKFVRNHINNEYCHDLVKRSFDAFVSVQVSKYSGYHELPVSFTGSVAANFSDILQDVLIKHQIIMGKLIKEPMEGLIEYHRKKIN